MTIHTTGSPIAVSEVSTEIGQVPTYSTNLTFLNDLIKPTQRAGISNLSAFYSLQYYLQNNIGNCDNANAAGVNCNCGNVQCYVTQNCIAINCVNCDAQSWLQIGNCNTSPTPVYNCTANQNCFSYNCNCSKIICTKLHELGLMPTNIFEADQAFGTELIKNYPDIYNGYVAWAQVVVDWMSGTGPNMMPWLPDSRRIEISKRWSTAWAKDIATPWATWMAYKMGAVEESNKTGFALMLLGAPICKVIGMWQRVFGKSTTPPGFGKGLLLIAVFILLKGIATIGSTIENFKGTTNE